MKEHRYDSPRRELVPFLPYGARTVLDVGCSSGGFGISLLARHPGLEVWGVEPEDSQAKRALNAGYKDVRTGFFPDVNLPDRHFDAIFFNDILEHVLDPQATLAGAKRFLAPGGHVVASIPNVRHMSVWWPLIRHGRWDYTDIGLLDRTHLRFFTKATMVEMFRDTGWTVESVAGINRARALERARNTPKIRALSRLTRGRSDDYFFIQYVVTAAPT